ncbi:uncharacterized protein isoform X2 [Choristoneura fumiferana]|uniref:uncharacterized protein isoform X2 n=1 Tax=Choristoneura fumiferana TaxID=7141 RepID=UPI003D15907E
MLISRVSDDNEGEERAGEGEGEDIAQDYQTASELFELMAKDHNFEATEEEPLTTRDLVLLYKNIDLGKQLMSNVNELKRTAPNQYVETVIYPDEQGSESEVSEAYSSEDLQNIVLVNKERIDLLTNNKSHTLCHKLGDLEIQTSNVTTEYERQFLLKDMHLQEQLKSLKIMASSNQLNSTMLPASLLDYICCKRLEDNYNFYMDNIIKYVKNTIEQLKRISNGDYLTDKAKKKWKEVEKENDGHDKASKVLTASTSIPLHVERKLTGLSTTWDDIVHSEVDLRSLAKILEKKIVLEVPKLICGSYKLFSNRVADNLIISCQHKEMTVAEKKTESRVDVVFQLKRSETGEVVSNIDSIMILQSQEPQKDCIEALSLTYDDVEDTAEKESPKIIELLETERNNDCNQLCSETDGEEESREDWQEHDEYGVVDSSSTNDYPTSENEHIAALSVSFAETPRGAGSHGTHPSSQTSGEVVTPDDIQITIQALNRRPSPTEKNADCTFHVKKKRSPTRVRIKSPYENKSHIMEEKKRRKLLEVKERRERRKIAMNENKISKHKNFKSAITPQASSSVTKLSITNKSFYNSIYGQNFNSETANPAPLVVINKAKGRKGNKNEDMIPEIVLEQPEEESEREEPVEKDGRKYINRSYYLDDAVTEMSLQMTCEKTSASTSAISNDSGTNLSLACAEMSAKELRPKSPEKLRLEQNPRQTQLSILSGALSKVPTNTPKGPATAQHHEPADTIPSTVECRRSIEKIYMLMKKLGKIDSRGNKKGVPSVMDLTSSVGGPASSELQTTRSDSGTSLKHQLPSSNPSNFSFEKPIADGLPTQLNSLNDRPVAPKVIICSKEKLDTDKLKKEPKKTTPNPHARTVPDNPLKAISQLLHEFDNVQKTRQKTVTESKSCNRAVATEGKTWRPDQYKRRVRIDLSAKEEPPASRAGTPKARPRAGVGPEANKTQVLVEKKKISDLIEEAKEARGEAVRGPGRLSTRLDMLAQPKRPYVPARADDRPARAQMDRLARGPAGARARARRPDPASPPPSKPPQPSERGGRRRPGTSPDGARGEPRAPAALPPMLKKKMVAVESYVKSHYGRSGGAGSVGHLSRAPLLPSDVELSSITASTEPEESGAIGSKLHRIVHSMLARRDGPRPSLDSMAQNVSHPDPPSTESDTSDDIFADKQIVTAVEAVPNKTIDERKLEPKEDAQALQPYGTVAELEMVEKALYRKLSAGAFPKRLRLGSLTLTPKHSLQGVMLLQSGDATSLLLNSKLSQNFKLHTSKSSDTGLPALPLSTTHLDFRLSHLPMQIATVGYAFPSYDRQTLFERNFKENDNKVDSMVLQNASSERLFRSSNAPSEAYMTENKTCQCFKGIPETASLECAVQADLSLPAAPLADPVQSKNQELVDTVSENNVETYTTDQTEVTKVTAKQSSLSDVSPKETVEESNKAMPCEAFEEKTEIIDYTTSLDMLVGLLNEIQKITTCTNDSSNGQDFGCRKRVEQNNSPKSLDSDSSLMSLYVYNTDAPKGKVETPVPETKTVSAAAMVPECSSKEVSAQFPDARDRQHANVFTEVPSRLHVFPGVGGTDSFLDSMLSGPSSSRSMVALRDCPAHIHSQPSVGSSNERALQVIGTNSVSVKSLVLFHNKNNAAARMQEQTLICKKMVKNAVLKRENSDASDALMKRVVLFENKPQRAKIMNKCCLNATEFDPMMKMKRDILVTVYSLLMLTVFAALSFPELLHQT